MENGQTSPPGGRSGDGSKTKGKGFLSRLVETEHVSKDRFTLIFQFFFPWVLLLTIAVSTTVALHMTMGWDVANGLLNIWIFYTLPPMGKEILIPKAINEGVPRLLAGFSTTAVDVCVSLFLIWNYDWVKRLPILGKKLLIAEVKGRDRIQNSKIFKSTTFIATTLFVLVPFSGSGGIGGTIIGRIVGMRPYRVLTAVIVGSLIGSITYSFVAKQILSVLEGNGVLVYIMNVSILNILAAVVAILLVRYVVKNPRMAAERSQEMVEMGLSFTETTIKKTEVRRKEAAQKAYVMTKETTDNVQELSRKVVKGNLDITTKPMEVLGPKGEELARRTREKGLKSFDSAQKITSSAIDTSLNLGIKTASIPFELAHEASLESIEMTREGVEEVKGVFIDTSDMINEATKRPKEIVKNLGKKREPDQDDLESS